MIFQHTIDKVLSGEQTQTRRLIKPNERLLIIGDPVFPRKCWVDIAFDTHDRRKWCVGGVYAVQPGRGMRSIASIKITGIRREDVREISYEDAVAEGFVNKRPFLELWASTHDKPAYSYLMCDMSYSGHQSAGSEISEYGYAAWFKYLQERPADRYQAWVLEFRLVEGWS